MLVRVWRTSFDASQRAKLVDYANRVSLPVLSSRPGNRGVIFYADGDCWTTLTIWDDQESIDRLDGDPEYGRIVAGILDLDVLGDSQETEVFSFEGGSLPGAA